MSWPDESSVLASPAARSTPASAPISEEDQLEAARNALGTLPPGRIRARLEEALADEERAIARGKVAERSRDHSPGDDIVSFNRKSAVQRQATSFSGDGQRLPKIVFSLTPN